MSKMKQLSPKFLRWWCLSTIYTKCSVQVDGAGIEYSRRTCSQNHMLGVPRSTLHESQPTTGGPRTESSIGLESGSSTYFLQNESMEYTASQQQWLIACLISSSFSESPTSTDQRNRILTLCCKSLVSSTFTSALEHGTTISVLILQFEN